MFSLSFLSCSFVNRHTGGLENLPIRSFQTLPVNRHTGGLENGGKKNEYCVSVNRHTGGLERISED